MNMVVVFQLIVVFLAMVVLLSLRYRPDVSRFELERMAKTDRASKTKLYFLDIYPGLKIFTYVLTLVLGITVCAISLFALGMAGTFLAFAIIVLALLLSRALHQVANDFIDTHIKWFVKYFAWTEILSKVTLSGDEPKIHSRQELKHLIETGDFMDTPDKMLVVGALEFGGKKVSDIMIPRDKLVTVSAKDTISPKLLDELHQSGHSVFPAVTGGVIVGMFSMNDALTLDKTEQTIADLMRPAPTIIHKNASLESALTEMKANHCCHLSVVNDSDKIIGLIDICDIMTILFGRKFD